VSPDQLASALLMDEPLGRLRERLVDHVVVEVAFDEGEHHGPVDPNLVDPGDQFRGRLAGAVAYPEMAMRRYTSCSTLFRVSFDPA
jgi:hypothetical protein